ncbi:MULTISPECIES: GFA family protein [unclassified Rhizobium]|uniref:GFA family protein n=1 Tax=unclassified Rhizobium TaxID=2613769 RepID=UPI000A2063FD|nr:MULTISPECIES: GFA family protein [unclassified Rhizobium]ARO30715.1 GFA family glutathione-dependent formaldehyde-activating protein [Rhizobium sp. NXC14]MDK4731431.1 GFA family protein [Rhizobium sp. CNPSo 3490]
MSRKYTGKCACGAIQFGFDTDPTFVAECHCLDCKKASGGEAATFFAVPQDDFALTSGRPKAFHYVADSGRGLDRNFCPECGARLFSSNLESFPGLVFVTLGSLDRPEVIQPSVEMFTKRRLAWATPLHLPQFEGMPS